MGLCGSKLSAEDQAALERAREIDRKARAMQEEEESVVKLLLLGTGDSGKSTIFKQMKLLYGEGYSNDELRRSAMYIYANCVEGMKTLILAAEHLGINVAAKEEAEAFLDVDDRTEVDEDIGAMIRTLWADEGIQATFAQRASFQIAESVRVYFDNIDRVAASDYVPTVQDVLYSRKTTTGIICESYVIDGNKFDVLDVGGQRNERKKWIHQFDDVTAIIFVVAISEYDQTLFEDEEENRIVEALSVFQDICNSSWFENKGIILFLNKRDLFKDKLQRVEIRQPSKDLFMECDVGLMSDADDEATLERGHKYMTNLFLSHVHNQERVYPHVTCATDSENMRHVLDSTKLIILKDKIDTSTFM